MEMEYDLSREMYEEMTAEGFDTTKPLNWGYFFTDDNKEGLEKVGKHLEKQGYTNSSYDSLDLEEDGEEGTVWQLYITRIETLTIDQLIARNEEFNKLAEEYQLLDYDGWDVEKV